MKIIFVCNEYPPRPHGGIGTFVQAIARGFCRKGHTVSVVGLGETSGTSTDHGVRVFSLQSSDLPYVGNLTSRLRLRRWLQGRIRAGEVDVIEAPEYLGLLPLGFSRCSVVIRLHQSYTAMSVFCGRQRGRGVSLYERCTLRSNTNWIGVSQFIVDLTRSIFNIGPEKVAIIHNPVPAVPEEVPEMPILPRQFLLYAGQLSTAKGAAVVAQAGRLLLERYPKLHLVYAGGAVTEVGKISISETIQRALGPSLLERVHFLGHISREEVLACMKRALVLAFPSQLESFGLVVLEAMSCGLPVVCTNYPPGPEIVRDGFTGLLADPKSPQDFAEKIARLIDDPTLAGKLAGNARSYVSEHFSLEKCMDATERFYQECLAG